MIEPAPWDFGRQKDDGAITADWGDIALSVLPKHDVWGWFVFERDGLVPLASGFAISNFKARCAAEEWVFMMSEPPAGTA